MPFDVMDDSRVDNHSQVVIDIAPQIFEEKAKDPSALDGDRQHVDAVQMSGASYSRLTPAHMHVILQLAAEGKDQAHIAQAIGCNQSTVSRFLRSVRDPQDVVQQVMKGGTLDRLTDWSRAARVAAKRGDHRPSREWIEAAHPELRPQTSTHGGGVGVTVVIGQPGQPVGLPVIDVQVQPLSPRRETTTALSLAPSAAVSDEQG